MDIKQMLPILLKGKLGEREKQLLTLTQNPNSEQLGQMLAKMYSEQQNAPRIDVYTVLKRIIPAQTLGLIIKYYEGKRQK